MNDATVQYEAPDDKMDSASVRNELVDGVSAEYHEYLRLSGIYQGEALRKLTRKIDIHVVPQLLIIYALSNIDRSNVGNARLFGAEKDMGLTATHWNVALSIFFVTYALAGPISNIFLKRFGPKKILPALLFTVSLVLVGSGCAKNKAAWFALRLLLGAFEAGMFPGCAYTLTTWYTPADLHSRISWFYLGSAFSNITGSLLAYGIGQLDGIWGYRGWRWIYVLEGCFSFVFAIGAYFWIQDTPAKQGRWLQEEERTFVILRNRFAYGHDQSGSEDDFNWRAILSAATSIHTWAICWFYFTCCIAIYGFSFTIPTIMNNLGFTAAVSQAMSAPPYAFAAICLVVLGWFSERVRQRMLTFILPAIMAWIGTLICLLTVAHKHLVALTYVGVVLAAGGLVCLSPACTAWIGLNSAGQSKRNGAIALTTVRAQFGGIVGSNIYLAKEKPLYHTGFGCALAFLGFGCIISPLIYAYYCKRVNAAREAMTEEEISAKWTPEQLRALGDKSPYYRYEY
ncbi:uncharacterized protein I303_106921 [Kwoniella dejecticola CBS 10117]|uniref:Major facilitator superfamily (MFS) profile domain-containing protein n=1 Tax=Kwoniella dejecticola CBS 10117 TaxID=1296121 RepID=A0A1A5ZTB5_9TREE|nr:uncharacterized protein I303_08440 [Kwoniella dejecticola CBS 10117]OBR81058.1 hypothetical protein I303_08440 [Kwoniella dejecticola CBS 10117]